MMWVGFVQFTTRILGSYVSWVTMLGKRRSLKEGILALNSLGPEVPLMTSTLNSVAVSQLTSGEARKWGALRSPEPQSSKQARKQAEFGESWPHTNLSHWCRLMSTFSISCRGVGSVSQGAVGTRLAGSQWQRLKYKAEHHWSNSWALQEQPYLQEEGRHPPPTDTEWPTEEKFRCLDYEPQGV